MNSEKFIALCYRKDGATAKFTNKDVGTSSQKQKINWKKKTETVRRNSIFVLNASQTFTVNDGKFDDGYGNIRHRILRASAYLGESQGQSTLTAAVCGFYSVAQAYFVIGLQIRTRLISLIFFPNHYLLTIVKFDAVQCEPVTLRFLTAASLE